MKQLLIAAAAAAFALGGACAAYAQDHHDDHGGPAPHAVPHPEWRKGGRIQNSDWARGSQVDWRAHHFRQPPNGYEWRYVDGNYVLAAVATGAILDMALGAP